MINLESLAQVVVLAANLNGSPNAYPECDWSTGQTRWVEQMPDGTWERYPLDRFPNQCNNPDGDNKVTVSGTVYQSDSYGAPLRGNQVVLKCPSSSTGFEFRPAGGKFTLNTFSGGLGNSQTEIKNPVAIYANAPLGEHRGRMIFGCYTRSGNFVPIREVEATVRLEESRQNFR